MSETTAHPARSAAACPHCGATRVPDVTWCTQCFAVLDAPAPAAVGPGRLATNGGPAAGEGFELSAWDVAQREAAASREGEPELDPAIDLAPTRPDGNALVGRVVALSGSPGGKAVIIAVGTVVLLGVFMGGLGLFGMFL